MKRSLILLTALFAFVPFGANSPSTLSVAKQTVLSAAKADNARKGKTITLSIDNSEDYIVGNPNDIPGDKASGQFNMIGAFEDYCALHDGVNVQVAYNTFSVMEDELSNLSDGAHHADLACVSDYIIQRLMANNMVVPFKKGADRDAMYTNGGGLEGWETDAYDRYASPFLKQSLTKIEAKIGGDDNNVGNLGDYARGYMWGTLGLTYNPTFKDYAARGLSESDVKVQMSEWNALWSSQYEKTFQVKDSMRDTYSIGLMHVYDSYFKTLLSWYKSGTGILPDGTTGAYSLTQYNADVSTIFNNINHIDDFNKLAKRLDNTASEVTPEQVVDEIQLSLAYLKEHSFGMEVDSGKTDIQTGDKSGIDTAWSGDAILSMTDASVDLYYSIPQSGGNIWFDAWVLVKSDTLEQEYAQKFIDFISNPENASPNMDYNGYTSFIGGDQLIDLVRGKYDARTAAMYAYHTDPKDSDSDGYLADDEGNYILKDGTGVHENTDGTSDDYGSFDMTGSTYDAPKVKDHGAITTWDLYAASTDFVSADGNAWRKVDLSYFFAGTEDSYSASDMVFYTDELEEVTGKNLAGEETTVIVGRRFLAQYPTQDEAYKGTVLCQIPGLAVMEDYRDNNDYVLRMWENVKAGGTIQPWIIVLFSLEVAASVGAALYFFIRESAGKALRKRRRDERNGVVAPSTK
jgi:spermidine/putrescine-binding protein